MEEGDVEDGDEAVVVLVAAKNGQFDVVLIGEGSRGGTGRLQTFVSPLGGGGGVGLLHDDLDAGVAARAFVGGRFPITIILLVAG